MLRYYFPTGINLPIIEKKDAVSVTKEELIALLKGFFSGDKPAGGVVIVMDSIGNEILFLCGIHSEESQEPFFNIEIPFFYPGRETNVSFIKTNRAWGPKPIRCYARDCRLNELEPIINDLPDLFDENCIPDVRLERSYFYCD